MHSAAASFTSHGNQRNYAEPPDGNRHILDFLHPILLCRITYWAPLQMLLPRWNQILTQLRFVHNNWVITGMQGMVHWWVLVYFGQAHVGIEVLHNQLSTCWSQCHRQILFRSLFKCLAHSAKHMLMSMSCTFILFQCLAQSACESSNSAIVLLLQKSLHPKVRSYFVTR